MISGVRKGFINRITLAIYQILHLRCFLASFGWSWLEIFTWILWPWTIRIPVSCIRNKSGLKLIVRKALGWLPCAVWNVSRDCSHQYQNAFVKQQFTHTHKTHTHIYIYIYAWQNNLWCNWCTRVYHIWYICCILSVKKLQMSCLSV